MLKVANALRKKFSAMCACLDYNSHPEPSERHADVPAVSHDPLGETRGPAAEQGVEHGVETTLE